MLSQLYISMQNHGTDSQGISFPAHINSRRTYQKSYLPQTSNTAAMLIIGPPPNTITPEYSLPTIMSEDPLHTAASEWPFATAMSARSSLNTSNRSFASAQENLLPPGLQRSANSSQNTLKGTTESLCTSISQATLASDAHSEVNAASHALSQVTTASDASFGTQLMNTLRPSALLSQYTDMACNDFVVSPDCRPPLRCCEKSQSIIKSLTGPWKALRNKMDDRKFKKIKEKVKRDNVRNKRKTDPWRDMRVPRRRLTILGRRSSGSRITRINGVKIA
ncbi:hypothetical protein BU16DRAFT_89365 [Lophium mytilinum]|uniref:Uncharacterized protein n=1 Tax=Lophium mytilinum TaxID=390894 RepID=A0A6A6QK92_9PEZI|nr:hypothetical protein BU16DRAFT_89365 [Lophium mytilinum]